MSSANGWAESADAWIRDVRAQDEFSRCHVLDAPMLAHVRTGGFARALDVGCGEGRFCRMLRAAGVAEVVGIDPTTPLLAAARAADPGGDYREGRAEALPFTDAAFDLVVSYLTLIDIPDIAAAIPEMARVLAPGGTLMIANLTSFNTAATIPADGSAWEGGPITVSGYLDDRAGWSEWRGIRIRNHHRPLARYMTLLIEAGLVLAAFEEPAPTGGDPERAARYRSAPWFHVMVWRKPA